MKNVLLVSPHSSAKENETRYVSPAPGVQRIAGYLMANGHYAEAFDPNLYDLNGASVNLDTKLRERAWDIVGVSCLEGTLVRDMENLWLAKEVCPSALLVAGGIEAQYNYQTLLDKTPCRVVITGEGEIPMQLICDGAPLHEVPGLVVKNDAAPLTKEQFQDVSAHVCWETIPFETYWDYYLQKYDGVLTDEVLDQIHTVRVYASNRCPFRCKFCTSTNQLPDAAGAGVKPFGMKAEALVDLIARIVKAHPRTRTVYLTDDDFCLVKKDVIDFCKAVLDRGLNCISYMCFARVTDLDDEMLRWMKKASFRRLNIGAESFSDKVLKEVGKKYKAKAIGETLAKVKAHGLQAFITAMLVTPESTLEDIELTVNGISELIFDSDLTFGLAPSVRPTKGSQFYEMYSDFDTSVAEIQGGNGPYGRKHLVKENKTLYAKDPRVKRVQILFHERQHKFVSEFVAAKKIKHATYSNTALAQLRLMKQCIDQVRQEKGAEQ